MLHSIYGGKIMSRTALVTGGTRGIGLAISKGLMAVNAVSAVTYQILSVTVLFWLQRHLIAHARLTATN